MNTKKDFIRAASITQAVGEAFGEDARKATESAFAAFFRTDNPRFDEQRFREACK